MKRLQRVADDIPIWFIYKFPPPPPETSRSFEIENKIFPKKTNAS